MATARAIANGNWSSTSTWNGGVLPGNGDTVYANGFNVTINQNINIGGANNPTVNAGSFVAGQWYEILFVGTTSWTGIGAASNTAGTIFLATGAGAGTGNARALATLTTASNTAAGATGGGGSFAMSSPFTITTDLRAGTTTCLSVTGATALTLDGLRVVGSAGAVAFNYAGTTTCTLSNATIVSGTGGGASAAMINSSTGTVNVTSPCTFTGSGGIALNNSSSGTINIASSCTFAGGGSNAHGLSNISTGSVNITASCAFTGGIQTSGGSGVNNASNGTINITASCTFTAGNFSSCFALNNASTGTVIVTQGTFTASAFSNAVSSTNTSADVRLSGDFLDHWSGWRAVNSPRFRLGTTPTAARQQMALAGTTDSYVNFYTADNTGFGLPAATDVRSGVSYGGGAATGICAVPAASSVAFGVSVDNTTGTAVLTPAAIRAELATELGRIDQAISSRLAAVDFVAPANSDISAIKAKTDNLPSDPADQSLVEAAIFGLTIPSVVQIRTELDSNSAKLANLDATISSRSTLTTGDLPSVPSAASVASAVRTELTELSNLDASVSSRLASADYTAPTSAPTAAAVASAVRAELTEISNLDASISSRLAAADYTAPTSAPSASTVAAAVRTELGTELGRIDQNISSRLASADYTTPPTTAQIATAVEGSLLDENDGQAVLNAIVGAIGNQNVDEIALVAAVRADLERAGGKLDSIPTATAPSAASVASAVWSASTKEITGGTVTTLTNSPDVPTEAEIAAQVRTELSVELGRIDQAISTRLASADYTAPSTPPTASAIADEVRVELASELANLDAPVSGATAPSAATVASQVRTELTPELAKVSALNTERLANVATTAIVGNLLAQANS